jgi:hypothetical protein
MSRDASYQIARAILKFLVDIGASETREPVLALHLWHRRNLEPAWTTVPLEWALTGIVKQFDCVPLPGSYAESRAAGTLCPESESGWAGRFLVRIRAHCAVSVCVSPPGSCSDHTVACNARMVGYRTGTVATLRPATPGTSDADWRVEAPLSPDAPITARRSCTSLLRDAGTSLCKLIRVGHRTKTPAVYF